MSEAFYKAMEDGVISQEPYQYSEVHIKDFNKSGLSIETVRKAGYESIPEKVVDDGLDSRGRKKKKKVSGFWRVPITNPITKEIYYYRKRLDEPIKDEKAGRETKYLSPEGSKVHVYFSLQVDDWEQALKEKSRAVIITEGEKKADKAIQEGFLAVSIAGVYGFSSDGEPIDDLKFFCTEDRPILILLDSDCKNNPHVQTAFKKLKQAIHNLGAKAIDCCLPGPEKGLDDFLVARGRQALVDHLEACMTIYDQEEKQNKEVEKAAWNMLKNPNMLQEIKDDVHSLGIIGEDENILRIYLCFITHKFDSCLGFILKGSTSSGKTTQVKTIAKLMPEGIVHDVTSQSLQALNYWTDIRGKIIIVTEARPPDDKFWEIDSAWRQLIEDNKITRVIVDHNEKDINKKRREIIVYGPIVYCCTTTQPKLHAENENRLLIFYTNDNPEHVKEIISKQFSKIAKLVPDKEKQYEFIIAKHRKAIELLQPYKLDEIQVPYGEQLSLGNFGPEASRDAKKLTKLIKTVAFLFQYQRSVVHSPFSEDSERLETNKDKGLDGVVQSNPERGYLVVCEKDYQVIYQLFKDYFDSNSTQISNDLQDKWKAVQNKLGDQSFIRKDLEKIWGLKKTRVHDLVKEMLKEEMLTKLDNKDDEFDKNQKEDQYRLRTYNLRGAGLTRPEDIQLNGAETHTPLSQMPEQVNDQGQTQSPGTIPPFTGVTERPPNEGSCLDKNFNNTELSKELREKLQQLNAFNSSQN